MENLTNLYVNVDRQELDAREKLFNDSYTRNFSKLFVFAKTIVKSSAKAEDVVAEVFLNLWKNREKYDKVKELDAYLFISVKNLSLKMVSGKERNLVSLDLLETNNSVDQIDPEELLLESELQEFIDELVRGLPDQCQLVFRLAKEKQMSYKEISEELGIAVNTVKAQIVKALGKIREALMERYKDDSGKSEWFASFCTLFLA